MNNTNTLQVIVGFASVCVTQAVIWAEGRRRSVRTESTVTRTEEALEQVSVNADTAAIEAASAAQRVVPVSNGFATKVLTGLATLQNGQTSITEDLKELRRKLDGHIGDHASADVRRHSGDNNT